MLTLYDSDVRTHVCVDELTSATTTAPAPIEFGFSTYEESESAEAALNSVIEECEQAIATGGSVLIQQVAGHLEAPINNYITQLRSRNVDVSHIITPGTRTSIVVR